jgi:hypothetical protein
LRQSLWIVGAAVIELFVMSFLGLRRRGARRRGMPAPGRRGGHRRDASWPFADCRTGLDRAMPHRQAGVPGAASRFTVSCRHPH